MSVEARTRWVVLALLVVSICINYADRGNLSVAADPLARELDLDPKQVGNLLSAFFWTYASFQIVAGWLIDRFNVNSVYALGFLLWSAATGLTGFVQGFVQLFTLRLILGVGEAVAYPAYSKIIASGFPEHQRGFANALIDVGSKTGPALGLVVGGSIVSHFGWRAMFVSIGFASLLWLLPWQFVTRGLEQARVPAEVNSAPGIPDILRQRSAWGTFLGLFCANYAWYFLLTWLPWYLVRERHYSTQTMALYGSLPFWGVAVSSLAGGWLSDRWIARGGSPTLVRKTFAVSGLVLGTLMLPSAIINDQAVAMMFLVAACISFGLYTSHGWVITQRMAGPEAAGKWTGLQNAVGNLAGIVAPVLTGWIVKETGEFFYAFVTASGVLVVGALSYLFVVGKVTPIQWNKRVQM